MMGSAASYVISGAVPGRNSKNPQPPACPKQYPTYVSTPVEELHGDFVKFVCCLLIRHTIFGQSRRKDPTLKFRKPDHLRQVIDFELKKTGSEQMTLLGNLRKVVHYCSMSSHPYSMFQLLSGLDPYSVIGNIVTSISPSTMTAYRDAPVYYEMEHEISFKLRQLAGYPAGTGDCIFPSGCSLATMYAMVLARHAKFPETKQKGVMHLPPLVIFVSQDSHCCYQKGAIFTGIGLDNVVFIKTNNAGKMSVVHLLKAVETCVKSGKVPLMVGATSGTNVFGAFDPLEDIYSVCKQYNMWLHSDGAIGGGLIFSETQRQARLKDIRLCDSFCGSFHKIGSAEQTMSYFLTPHNSIITEALCLGHGGEDFSSFMEVDKMADDYFHSELDTYDKYLEHTRRPDIVKLFMMIKGKGYRGMEANIDAAYEKQKFLLEELKKRQNSSGNFLPLMDEYESPVVTFYYVPSYLQRLDRSTVEFKDKLDLHTRFLFAELIQHGIMLITVQTLRQSPLFFKMTTYNSALTCKDYIYLLDQIDNYGKYLRVPYEMPLNEINDTQNLDSSGGVEETRLDLDDQEQEEEE